MIQKYLLSLSAFVISIAGFAQTSLSVEEFHKQLNANGEKNLVDVRTPEEYVGGHLAGFANINWNDTGFAKKIALLPKDRPVYVYCLSGGRSAKAADYLKQQGFGKVYEMEGGLIKWRAAKLPEEKPQEKKDALTKADFEKAIGAGKIVLVDFYADWCLPCKQMEPFIKEIEKEKAAAVDVLRINIDENSELAKELGIDALPVLRIYKNAKISWEHKGLTDKKTVVANLK